MGLTKQPVFSPEALVLHQGLWLSVNTTPAPRCLRVCGTYCCNLDQHCGKPVRGGSGLCVLEAL